MKTKITIADFIKKIDFEICEVFEYQWDCYGMNTYSIGWQEKKGKSWVSASIVYSSKNQKVYEMSVWDEINNKVYG
jgi:hypothetical protein